MKKKKIIIILVVLAILLLSIGAFLLTRDEKIDKKKVKKITYCINSEEEGRQKIDDYLFNIYKEKNLSKNLKFDEIKDEKYIFSIKDNDSSIIFYVDRNTCEVTKDISVLLKGE